MSEKQLLDMIIKDPQGIVAVSQEESLVIKIKQSLKSSVEETIKKFKSKEVGKVKFTVF